MYGCLNLKTIYFISIICNQTSPSGNKGQVPVTDSDIVLIIGSNRLKVVVDEPMLLY